MEAQTEQTSTAASTEAVSTPAVSESSAPVQAETSSASEPAAASPAAMTQAEQIAQYTPNFKFTAADKEHEIDEWVRPVIKDAETEKKIKELYSKAYGMEEVKAVREKMKQEYYNYKSQAEPLIKTVSEAHKFYTSGKQSLADGNINGYVHKTGEAFKQLGITDEDLKKYVFHKLNIEELPQDRKQEYNRFNELELQNQQLQQQTQEQQRYVQQLAVQARTADLNQATSKSDIAPIVQAFDQRNGAGSFNAEVIQRGQLYWQTQGIDVPAEKLVQEIITKYGLTPSVAPQATAQVQPQTVPTIPVIKGGSSSPAGKVFKTTDDLVNYRKQQYGY